MSKHSPNAKNEFMEEKRKLMYWFARWTDEEAQFDNLSFDIADMSVLLQAIGFRLDTFEKAFDSEHLPPLLHTSSNMPDKNMMRIELTCPKSGMRSTLIKQTPSCKCPSEEALDKGEFWYVIGFRPSSQSSINTSNSSLLPTITPAKTKIIKGLLSKVLMVNCNTDLNENEDIFKPTHNLSLLTRHRSLDTLKKCEDNSFNSRGLKRRPSWEVDPKTSPPTQTSSPIPNLCATMSQISLEGEQSNVITQNLESIKKLVDETLFIASENNATFVQTVVPRKRVSDIKPTEGPYVRELITLGTQPVTGTISRRVLTPKKMRTPGEKKDVMAPPSKIGMFRKKPLSTGISPKPLLRRDTPRAKNSLLVKNQATSRSCEHIVKSKISTVRAGASPRYGRVGEAPGTSGILKCKTVGRLTLNAITHTKKKI